MATKTWTGGGADALASTGLNWDTTTAPGAADAAVFDGAFPVTGNKNCTWDVTADLASLVTTGYSGLITASATAKVSGTVTFANSTWAHGNQLFILDATATINPGTAGNSFYDFDFTNSNYTFTLANNMTVTHDLILNDSVSTTIYSGNGGIKKIFVGGNVTATNGRSAGNTTTDYVSIELNGTGAQTYTGNTDFTNVPGTLIFNKASGTATMAGGIIPYMGITHTLGTVDFTTNSVATNLKDYAQDQTITSNGSITFYDYNLSQGHVLTLADNMTIAHNLDIGAGTVSTATINGSTILLSGNLSNTGDNQILGTTNITFTGSGSQTWSAGGTTYVILSGGTMNVNKSGGTLTVSGTVRWDGDFVYTAGTVSTTSSTVRFVGSKNINSGTLGWATLQTYSSGTRTLTGNLSAINITIDSGTTLSCGSNTVTVTGNVEKTGTFTAGTSTVIFSGTSTASVNGIAFNNLTISAGATLHLTSTKTYSVAGLFTATGNTNTLDAVTATSAAIFNVNGTQNVGQLTATDMDSSGGNLVHNYVGGAGTNLRTVNWDTAAGASFTGGTMAMMGCC